MTDVWFYHLQTHPLERVLPTLVERVVARDWNGIIQCATEERLAQLDDLLWTYAEDSFIPHGTERDGDAASQKIWLTLGQDNPNASAVRFFVEGADPAPVLDDPALAPSERAIILFNGRDEEAVAIAREQFKILRNKGHALSYWRQAEGGRWEKTP